MLSKFFIDRPVLAWVCAILTVLLGSLVLPNLKLARFPDIAPPTISISLRYPGASAETLENSVAQVVEQQMTGLDNLLYFTTTVNAEGRVDLRFSFDQSVDPDVAQMQVQNRFVHRRLPRLVIFPRAEISNQRRRKRRVLFKL